MRPVLVACAFAIATSASPAGAEDVQRIVIAVGETATREVGWAMGHVCDDEEIVDASMRNQDADTNVFVVRGKRAGTTMCRAGTYHVDGRPTYLFEVTVVARR